MKRLEALIPHDLIQDVEKALIRSGIKGLTLTSVYAERLPASGAMSCRRDVPFGTPCCKLDVLVSDAELPKVRRALARTLDARLSTLICVVNLESTIRIRTGECEEAALQ